MIVYQYDHATTSSRVKALGVVTNDNTYSVDSVADLGAATSYFGIGGVAGSFTTSRVARFGVWSGLLAEDVITSIYNGGYGKSYTSLAESEKTNLISFWNLDEASGDRADSHGSNTLTDNNTVTSATNSYPANLPGTVASFVAANSERLTVATTLLAADSDFTMSVWVNQADNSTIRSFISDTSGDVLLRANATDVQFYAKGASPSTSLSGVVEVGAWVLYIITYDHVTDAMGISKNGGSETTQSSGGANGAIDGTISLGVWGGGGYMNGLMSSVAIWPRVLTADERAALWNSGDGAPLP